MRMPRVGTFAVRSTCSWWATLAPVRQGAHVIKRDLSPPPAHPGKSQFMKFAANVSPRSVITTGRGSTSAGLTASAVKDGQQWLLEVQSSNWTTSCMLPASHYKHLHTPPLYDPGWGSGACRWRPVLHRRV